ncbi:MAG: FtsX-like permease family protein [Pseudomonadota bacterium]|nr:FtsX-like permease family protein [Pseudomonadota bacterium]
MPVLDRKLLRDLGRLWAQALALALVMACGVATILIAVGASRSLEETRNAFYERYRFASVFSGARRAPLHLRDRIEAIPGVSASELRIVRPTLLDIEGMAEPATGIAVSVPDFFEPNVNRLYMRKGRMPEAGRENEIAVNETFAKAHGFSPGDGFEAVMNGRKRALTIVGIVLSPEYVYAIGPGDLVPDNRRFGIIYMSQKALAGLFDMEDAFNDVVLTTRRNADVTRISEALDDILEPYGGSGAHGRKDQVSHAFLDSELTQLDAMARVIPPIFLFVSAFLVNMILSRLVALEREQIGLLKAVGHGDLSIGWHYAKLVIAISLVGLVIGAAAGTWAGQGLTRLYASFYSFPFLIFRTDPDLYLLAGGVTIAAALAGAVRSILSILNLPPAVAMRPPAPTRYRSMLGGMRGQWLVSQLTIMAIRHLIRWPVRSSLTILGTSMSVALLVTALFSIDSIDEMIDTVYFKAERQDATLTFAEEASPRAIQAAANLPGVLRVEPYRATTVELRNGHRSRRMSLIGTPPDADLSRVLDLDQNPIPAPADGVMLTERAARLLHLRVGDRVTVEFLEKDHRTSELTVTAIAQSYIGLTAYMGMAALDRAMPLGPRISGVRVEIDQNMLDAVYEEIKNTPAIASITLQGVSRKNFRDTIAENIVIMTSVYITLAVVITIGVIYNSARIQLSERARELASLRVLGFTRMEVSGVLLTELGIIVVLAQPLGWLLGWTFAWSVAKGFESDLFRIPLVVSDKTFAVASLVVLGAAFVSALIVRRRIDHFDLVAVLKTRE